MFHRALQTLSAIFGRRPATGLSVCLYTRAGCCACTEAKAILEGAGHRFGYVLTILDVDADEELNRLYGEQVPVVTVGGKIRFRGSVNKVLLIRLLRKDLDA
jgi:glutaredoxin